MLYLTLLSAQCPDRSVLWERIIYLKDSSQADVGVKLKELLQYDKAIQDCPYKYDSTHAYLLQRIGVMYFKQADYLHAVEYTREAIDIIKTNQRKANINPQRLIDCYFNLMFYYDSLGLINKKNEITDSCIRLALNMKAVDEKVLEAMENRAGYLFNAGDYQGCVNYASMGETVAKNYHLEDSRFSIGLFTWHINSLLLSKNYPAAEQILQKGIDEYMHLDNYEYAGTIYSLLAELAKEKGDFKRSLFYYQQSVQNDLRAGFIEGYTVSLYNIGFLYFEKLHQYNKALPFYCKALKYANATESLNIMANIANVYVQKKQFDSAYYFFQRAFDQIKPGINEKDLLQHTQDYVTENITEYVTSLVLDKADAYLTQFKTTFEKRALVEALKIYKTADLLLEKIKLMQYETQSKLFWRSHARRLYEHAIEACYLENNSADAFYFFEKSRAVLLNDQLNEQRWLGETDILKQSQLKRQIFAKERKLNRVDQSADLNAEIQGEIFNDQQELDKVQDQIKARNPLYSQNLLDSAFISVHDVQQDILKDHEAVIEILSGDNAVYLLAIVPGQVYLHKINRNVFDSLSSAFIEYISDPDLLNSNPGGYFQVSQQLYRLMFQNMDLPKGRIIISPDGKYFPFEALVTSTQPLTYFLDDHAVSYTYSARYLLNTFNTSSSGSDQIFMGVAPMKFTGLADLAGSDQSLNKVGSYFSQVTNYIGSNASKNNFLNEFYKYKIIQLYTHATDSGSAGEPMIYFADSTLNLSDLLPEKKPATNLIVLSACQTASGKLYSGEGVFSFNRSFAALGIPSSVSNLWQVDNKSTYRLTELFYEYISGGMPLDLALQKAKKEFIKTAALEENKLPYYWAASILVGKTDEIPLPKKRAWWPIIGILFLASIVLGGWLIRRRMSFQLKKN
ncbi:MAG: CHAT domain-containing protein [Chitinophagales bacterium]